MFFKSSNTTIGIDLRENALKIVEMDVRGKLPTLVNYYCGTCHTEDRDELSSHLRSIIEEKGLRGKRLNIALSSPSIQHKILTLPQMSRRETKAVLKREVKKDTSSLSGEIVYDSLILGPTVEKGIQKNKVLLVTVPKDEVNDSLAFWSGMGFELHLLTTVSLALLGSLKMVIGEKNEEATAALYLGAEKTFLIISDQGSIEFSRDLILGTGKNREDSSAFPQQETTPPADTPDSAYIDRVLTELNRSFLFYKQQFRGKIVKKIILAGEGAGLHAIRSALNQELEQEVDIFLPTGFLDTTHLEVDHKELQSVLPSLAISIGLCLKENRKYRINLMPLEIVEQKQLRVRKVALGGVSAIVFLALLFGYLGLVRSVSTQRKMLFEQQVFWREFAPLVDNLTQVQRERTLFQLRQSTLDNVINSGGLWKDRLKSLSIFVPDEMLFHRLQTKKRENTYLLEITGDVIAESAAAAQTIFNDFYHEMDQCPLFAGIKPPVITLSPHRETMESPADTSSVNLTQGGGNARSVGGESASKLTFDLSAEWREG